MTFVQIKRFCSVPVSVIIHEIYQDGKKNVTMRFAYDANHKI